MLLGARLLFGRERRPHGATPDPVPLPRVFGEGVVTELLNPKGALFFVAFLPQFVDPAQGAVAVQILFFGLLFHVTGVSTNLVMAVAGGAMARWLARRTVLEPLRNRLAGAVLIGLGVRLALSEWR